MSLTAAVPLSHVTAQQQSRAERAMQDVKAAVFALTCPLFNETGASWQLLNIEVELNLQSHHQSHTNINIGVLSIFGGICPTLKCSVKGHTDHMTPALNPHRMAEHNAGKTANKSSVRAK